VLSSDVDTALVWEGDDRDPAIVGWMRALAGDVLAGLERCGLKRDPHDVVATDVRLARSMEAWRSALAGWIADPTANQGALYVSLLCDSRVVWGDGTVAPLIRQVLDAGREPRLVRVIGRFALHERPPTGFLGNLVVGHSGEHAGRLDLKHGGLNPVTALARYAALAAGTSALTTPGRLAAAAGSTLSDDDARVLTEAFDLLSDLRIAHQIAQLRDGDTPDDLLDPDHLNPLSRRYLREAFRAVARVQRGVEHDLGG
jgi:CBS domain-containing protein